MEPRQPEPRQPDTERPTDPLHGEHGQPQSHTLPTDAEMEQLANAPDVEEPEVSDRDKKLIERELEHERRRAHKTK